MSEILLEFWHENSKFKFTLKSDYSKNHFARINVTSPNFVERNIAQYSIQNLLGHPVV